MRNYRDLVAWQVAFELARRTYQVTESFPKSEAFGLSGQLRRCAVSIASNIAEGAGRTTRKEFAHFVSIARGSLNEYDTQMLLARELGFADGTDSVDELIERLYGLINGLRNSLND